MNAKKINTLFKHPEQITSEDLIGLKQAVDDFPYAAPLHALYMKALQKKESYLLPGQIKRAAIATPNRAALKEFHDMPIPGMERAKEIPVVDFTEAAEAGKVEEVAVPAKVAEPEEAEVLKESVPEKKPEVKEPVKLDAPKPKSAPAKPNSVPKDLSHLPEAVRQAILRSRALRGEETPASTAEEKKPAEVVEPAPATPVKKEVQPAPVEEPAEEKPIQEKSKLVPKKPASSQAKSKKAPKVPKQKVEKKQKTKPTPVEEKLELREMPFSEKASFMEWLTADFSDGAPKKVERSAPKDVKTIISELPKFPVPKKDGKIDVFHLPSDDQGKFVTETLAEIYLKQALWDKAINAYEVLSLKYPEKSGFFADRIREIKKQKN